MAFPQYDLLFKQDWKKIKVDCNPKIYLITTFLLNFRCATLHYQLNIILIYRMQSSPADRGTSKKLSGRWRCFKIKRFRSFHRIGSIWTRSFRSLNKKIQHGIQDRQSTWPWLSYNTTYIPSISYSFFTQPWLKLLSRLTKILI